jgi:uncharacterized protein YciI
MTSIEKLIQLDGVIADAQDTVEAAELLHKSDPTQWHLEHLNECRRDLRFYQRGRKATLREMSADEMAAYEAATQAEAEEAA